MMELLKGKREPWGGGVLAYGCQDSTFVGANLGTCAPKRWLTHKALQLAGNRGNGPGSSRTK
jgi:hypothetical protein